MCGRFTLTRDELGDVAEALEAEVSAAHRSSYRPRYNVAPTDVHWIARVEGGGRRRVPAAWGLTRRGGPPIINARAETVATKPLFRDAFRSRRCLVPADGFYEWIGRARDRRPIWFHPRDGGVIVLAGLFEEGHGSAAPSFTILTTEANADVAVAHDRMPVVLAARGEPARRWLLEPAADLLVPAPPGFLVATPVSRRVNSVANDDPSCLGPPEGQQTLW